MLSPAHACLSGLDKYQILCEATCLQALSMSLAACACVILKDMVAGRYHDGYLQKALVKAFADST